MGNFNERKEKKMKTFVIWDIEWDTEDCDGEVPDLPGSVQAKVSFDYERDGEPSDFLADWLSDNYGFCVKGFYYEDITEDEGKTRKEVLISKIAEAVSGIFPHVEQRNETLYIETTDGHSWKLAAEDRMD